MDERRPRISEAHFNGAGKPSLIGLPPRYRVDYRYSCHNVKIPSTDHQSGLLFFQLGLFSTGNLFPELNNMPQYEKREHLLTLSLSIKLVIF